jgi:hypothetical protein
MASRQIINGGNKASTITSLNNDFNSNDFGNSSSSGIGLGGLNATGITGNSSIPTFGGRHRI